jgi:hypothetical protein
MVSTEGTETAEDLFFGVSALDPCGKKNARYGDT